MNHTTGPKEWCLNIFVCFFIQPFFPNQECTSFFLSFRGVLGGRGWEGAKGTGEEGGGGRGSGVVVMSRQGGKEEERRRGGEDTKKPFSHRGVPNTKSSTR